MNPTDDGLLKLRSQARWRSMILPGAGYAILGHSRWARRTMFTTLIALAAMIGVCFLPNVLTLTVALVLIAAGFVVWLRELREVKTLPSVAGPSHFLNRGFGIATLAVYLFAACVLVLAFTSFGALVVSSDSEIVNLPAGSKVLFNRHLQTSALHAGALIAFQGAADDERRDLDIGRILAAPGDRINIDPSKNEYLVNDKPAGKVGESIDNYITLSIPTGSEPLTLPNDLYLIVLEPADSDAPRHITQLRRRSIVSHRLWRISSGMPTRLE